MLPQSRTRKLRLQITFEVWAKRVGADGRPATWVRGAVRKSPPGPVPGPVRGSEGRDGSWCLCWTRAGSRSCRARRSEHSCSWSADAPLSTDSIRSRSGSKTGDVKRVCCSPTDCSSIEAARLLGGRLCAGKRRRMVPGIMPCTWRRSPTVEMPFGSGCSNARHTAAGGGRPICAPAPQGSTIAGGQAAGSRLRCGAGLSTSSHRGAGIGAWHPSLLSRSRPSGLTRRRSGSRRSLVWSTSVASWSAMKSASTC